MLAYQATYGGLSPLTVEKWITTMVEGKVSPSGYLFTCLVKAADTPFTNYRISYAAGREHTILKIGG
jgi:hypothetical protein